MLKTFDNFLTTIANGNDDIFFMLLSDKFLKMRNVYELLKDDATHLKSAEYHDSADNELIVTFQTDKFLGIARSLLVDHIRSTGCTVEITETSKKISIYMKMDEPTYEHTRDF